ncbi:UDP-N-acetylmuramoyl-tripeptide--D-alanyl-D-alanine ligase [Sporobacter termitidis DSM 10068]|uniref:UDP-N-acetylmuramoyl-tripeptide--D-alanyl-D-alanine ligase n=1 Tax=Sporobacter termitidis DSM 10068 TaxID=1123282 RepID=A0A1M5ZCM0_9FIRM|nr:UDP-N-acetylmuramoyl-tripeptide--D-alanyl-D-alanine ligase [Sporobacter termitidis]SHI21985.1 UDP-N-acetylmuramoyl-tripeptide--D-alanyl-D-alanine ligase [Sporobacter termitidis DSM 10068]
MGMKPLTQETIARVTGGEYIGDDVLKSACITGVVRDNREAFEGCLFVCIRGERVDGHSYANKAFGAGASCCLAEQVLPDARGPYVLVESTLAALKALGEYYRSLFNIPVVGVTGSVGKTTAKEMVAAVLSQKFNVLKTPENLNNEIGVPLTLLSLREEHEAAVVEMGISDFGEMRRLSKMVRPDICLMTAIGYCHLEQLGDLNGVLRAKSEVFEYMKPDGLAVVNGDDTLLASFDPGIKKLTFGLGEKNDFRAVNIHPLGTTDVSCDIVSGSGCLGVRIPAFGSHMVLGALPAAAIGRHLGLGDEDIRLGLLNYAPVGGRANIVDTGYITLIDDCYNANPNSMAASVRSLATLEGRRVAILGDMTELGYEADALHRALGTLVAKSGIDCLVCCGAKAEFIYKGLVSTGVEMEAWHFPMKEALFAVLPSLIKKGDSVLVKASHSMHFEEIAEELKKLS